MIQAIQTEYKGYRFRSRLEAKWAVFLDALALNWEYETEGFDLDGLRYLPDFWLPQDRTFLEVKPVEPDQESLDKIILLATKFKIILVVGMPDEKVWRLFTPETGTVKEYPVLLERVRPGDWTLAFGEPGEQVRRGLDFAVRAARSARFEHGETPQDGPFNPWVLAPTLKTNPPLEWK